MANRRSKRKSNPKADETAATAAGSSMPPGKEAAESAASAPLPHRLDPSRALFPALPSLSRILSVVILILGIIAVGALFYKVMASFFVPLFLAALLVVIFRPVHLWIYHRIGDKPRLASLATTFLILAVVLMPVILLISVATGQFTAMVSHMNFNDLTAALDRARDQLGISLPHAEQFRRLDVLTDSLDKSETLDQSLTHEQAIANVNEALTLIRYLQYEVKGPATAEAAASVAEARLNELMSPAVEPTADAPSIDAPAMEAQGSDTPVTDTPVTDTPVTDTPAADTPVADNQVADNQVADNPAADNPAAEAPSDNKPAADAPADALIQKLSAEEQFHRQSVVAAAAIRSWMRTLLGGTFRSQVRLFANPSAEDFTKLLGHGREALQPRFVTVTSATGSFLVQVMIGLIVLVIAVYFFLIDGPAMIHTLMRLSPLDDNYEARLLMEFDRTSRAVVLASVLSALAQGILAAIAFWILGFDSVILLFLLTSLMALVPFLGAASVWVPCVLYLGAVEQRWWAAAGLALYGAAIVSSIDNVIKVYVLHGRSTMHPLFALLSVLGGVKVFGPIGILVGPMVVVFLQTLLEILNHELAGRDASTVNARERENAEASAPALGSTDG